jgi:NTP pyrophosphatase (non-canonical NTP hydrolase)
VTAAPELGRPPLLRGFDCHDLICESFETARSKGWHDPAPSSAPIDTTRRSQIPVATFGDRIALIHSEASEALEAYRYTGDPTRTWRGENGKPEGVPSEIADIVIRIADLCGLYNIDLDAAIREKCAFNRTRPQPHRHGGEVL